MIKLKTIMKKQVTANNKRGRKKVSDPKKQVTFYTQTSNIERMGGMEKTREYLESVMEPPSKKK